MCKINRRYLSYDIIAYMICVSCCLLVLLCLLIPGFIMYIINKENVYNISN